MGKWGKEREGIVSLQIKQGWAGSSLDFTYDFLVLQQLSKHNANIIQCYLVTSATWNIGHSLTHFLERYMLYDTTPLYVYLVFTC